MSDILVTFATRAGSTEEVAAAIAEARFLRRHRGELERVPVAIFAMGPRSPEEEAWQRSRSQLDRALAKRSWLTPVAEVVFGGADPAQRRQATRRDLRD